jgi:hypothetical protein
MARLVLSFLDETVGLSGRRQLSGSKWIEIWIGELPTAVLEVFAANDVAALGEEELRYDTILRVDAVWETLDCLVVAVVDFRKGGGTDMAGKDDVERRDGLNCIGRPQ